MTESKEQFKEGEWKCSECDYVHIGEELPERCPKCNSPKEMFVESAEIDMDEEGEK